MGPITLALALGLAATGATPELVILPPSPEGVDEKVAIEAWNAITDQFDRDKAKLGVSMALQKDAHGAILGPGKTKAWACGTNTNCLCELGATLGADVLVSGSVDAGKVALIMLDVNGKKRISGAKSSSKLARRDAGKKAKAAAKGLVKAFTRSKPKLVARARPADPPPDAAAAVATAEPAEPEPELEGINGMIRVSADRAKDASTMTIDGVPATKRKDGSYYWIGAPGTHSVSGTRADGARFSKEVLVDPRQVIDLEFEWEKDTTPAFVGNFEDFEEDEGPKSPLQTWWFWTSVGVAVVAGGVTSAALLGGSKGGPSLPGNFGAISGTY
jgi:hypothetical protein